MEMVEMEFWTTSRIIVLGGSVSVLQEVYQNFQSIFGTCNIGIFYRADDKLPRTNNAVEVWHRGFQAHVFACHTVFWKFLEVLQKDETVVTVGILQNEGGLQPPPQRRKYVDCN